MNGIGFEAGNSEVVGVSLPLLQDAPDIDAWAAWRVTYRDVVILDAEGRTRGVFNLTEHDLHEASAMAELRARLLDARGR